MRLALKDAYAVGKRISAAREVKQWSQARLGREAGGYSRSSINKLEAGLRPEVSAAQMYGISRALGVTFEELWVGQVSVPPPRSPIALAADLARQFVAVVGSVSAAPQPDGPRPSSDVSTPPAEAGAGRGGKPSPRSRPSSR